jgi:hypothetical protein
MMDAAKIHVCSVVNTDLAWIIHEFAGEKRKGALKD